MKTKILFLLLIFCPSYTAIAQTIEWEQVTSIQNEWMNKVYAQGTNNVYIVGEKGLIAKSTDKALTWNKQYFPTEETLNDVIFCNNQTGFIVGNNGTILKTMDAGENWIQVASGTASNLNAIAATGLNNIWAVGNEGLTLHSIDGGNTWIAKNIAVNQADLYDIKFRNNLGYITGNGKNTYKTGDGGITWEDQIAFNDMAEQDRIQSLSITDNKVFALLNGVVNYGFGTFIYAAHDFNLNWSYLTEAGIFQSYYEAGICFQNDNLGFISSVAWSGGTGWIICFYKTVDLGNTWTESNFHYWTNNNSSISNISNFSFSETNEYGYFLSGQVLFRTPYTGEFEPVHSSINRINPEISVEQNQSDLQIHSKSKELSLIEIISIAGTKVQQQRNIRSYNANINIRNLLCGIYLMRFTFDDNTNEIVKWVKK